jgi:hypothetical protein
MSDAKKLVLIKAWAAIAKDVAATVGLLAAGYWAVFQFQSLHSAARAEAELSSIRQKNESEAAAHLWAQQVQKLRRPVLELAISEVTVQPASEGFYVFSTVTLTNKGPLDAKVEFGQAPFVAARVDFEQGVEQASLTERYSVGPHAQAMILRSGVSQSLPYVVLVRAPGAYLLEFRLNASVDDSEAMMREFGIAAADAILWRARRHVLVS